MKRLILLLIVLLCSQLLFSQCKIQITHTSGTKVVSGVSVSITSTGFIDTFTTYCSNTLPYVIGHDLIKHTTGPGAYNFTFVPPIDSLTLNFSGLTYDNTDGPEFVKLYINGIHYAIPKQGSLNGCDAMAVLSNLGDVEACLNCGLSGWNGTTIYGTISSLSVWDTSITGFVNGGSLFSLFISSPWKSGIKIPVKELQPLITPNPFNNSLDITLNNSIPAKILIFDITGKLCLQQEFTDRVVLNTEQFKAGVYFYELINEDGSVNWGKIFKQ